MSQDPTRLLSALPCPVALPGTDAYEQAMGTIFFADAAASRPSAVVQPRSTADVAAAVGLLGNAGVAFTVRGGGLSRECAHDGVVMLDLSQHLNTARRVDDRAVAGGGTTMGTVFAALEDIDHALPIGVYTIPGLGLATRGGVGYLTRGHGLTMDHIEEVELVVASGDVVTLSSRSSGDEADLWWAVRGCAPHLGVVTSITFRTIRRPRVFVHRAVLPLEALTAYFAVAPTTPRSTSVSAVVGRPTGQAGDPVLFLMTVHDGTDEDGVEAARAVIAAIAEGSPPMWEAEGTYRYMADDMPGFAVPELPGRAARQEAGPTTLFSKSPFTSRHLDDGTAREIARLARSAPGPDSRIDFQHMGGALGDAAVDGSSFWGRSAEWNNPVNAVWSDPESTADSRDWARDVAAAYAPHQVGLYSVELRSGLPETGAEVAAAFGPHLNRLAAIKQAWDPENVIREYFPLTPAD